jgi:hypothetical protein
MQTSDLNKKVEDVISANLHQLRTGKSTDWDIFQEKYWALKADIQHYERNPQLQRPSCFAYAVGIEKDADNQIKQVKQRWEKAAEKRRERASRKNGQRGAIVWGGGRADGNK